MTEKQIKPVRRDKNQLLDPKKKDRWRERNKERARKMESRVAKRLGGVRNFSSGSGLMKGDNTIPIDSHSCYIVECKLSEQLDTQGYPRMPLFAHMFTSLFDDVQAMASTSVFLHAKFGIIVFHYHNHSEDYVLLPDRYYSVVYDLFNYAPQPIGTWNMKYKKSGGVKKSITLPILEVRKKLGWELETSTCNALLLSLGQWENIVNGFQTQ